MKCRGLKNLTKKNKISCFIKVTQKSNKRLMAGTITRKQKREGQRKAKRHITHRNPHPPPPNIKWKEPVPLVVISYLTHSLCNVTYMQIMRSNSIGRSRTSITCEHNFPFYSRTQSTLKSNINMLPEKLNAKRQG
jgi:hypothetical protein